MQKTTRLMYLFDIYKELEVTFPVLDTHTNLFFKKLTKNVRTKL